LINGLQMISRGRPNRELVYPNRDLFRGNRETIRPNRESSASPATPGNQTQPNATNGAITTKMTAAMLATYHAFAAIFGKASSAAPV
jgi:hypothetical protein